MTEKEIVKDFTLLQVTIIDVDGRQHPINSKHLDFYTDEALERRPEIESIPWGELVGRRINSVCMEDGKLVLGLTTKDR